MLFIESILNTKGVMECLAQLLSYVKPSEASIMRKLFCVKQNAREEIATFVIRFRGVVVGSGVVEERLKEAFIKALVPS